MKRSAVIVTALAVAVGCGDPDVDEERGYTKAPLERPGLLVDAEEPTVMDELGEPDLLNERVPDHEAAARARPAAQDPGVESAEQDQGGAPASPSGGGS